MEVVTELAQIVMKNPTVFGSLVYDLSSNDAEKDGGKRFCDVAQRTEPIADVDRLRGIVRTNGFRLASNGGTGLFVGASYFNHSCVPNARYNMFNDVMVGFQVLIP